MTPDVVERLLGGSVESLAGLPGQLVVVDAHRSRAQHHREARTAREGGDEPLHRLQQAPDLEAWRAELVREATDFPETALAQRDRLVHLLAHGSAGRLLRLRDVFQVEEGRRQVLCGGVLELSRDVVSLIVRHLPADDRLLDGDVGHQHATPSAVAEGSDLDAEPGCPIGAVAGVPLSKGLLATVQDAADCACDARALGGPGLRSLADPKVARPHATRLVPQPVVAGELPPGSVDRDDRAGCVEHRRVGREELDSPLQSRWGPQSTHAREPSLQ